MRTELGQGSVSMVVGDGARVNDSAATLGNVHGCPEKHLRREMMR